MAADSWLQRAGGLLIPKKELAVGRPCCLDCGPQGDCNFDFCLGLLSDTAEVDLGLGGWVLNPGRCEVGDCESINGIFTTTRATGPGPSFDDEWRYVDDSFCDGTIRLQIIANFQCPIPAWRVNCAIRMGVAEEDDDFEIILPLSLAIYNTAVGIDIGDCPPAREYILDRVVNLHVPGSPCIGTLPDTITVGWT